MHEPQLASSSASNFSKTALHKWERDLCLLQLARVKGGLELLYGLTTCYWNILHPCACLKWKYTCIYLIRDTVTQNQVLKLGLHSFKHILTWKILREITPFLTFIFILDICYKIIFIISVTKLFWLFQICPRNYQ